MEPSKRYDRDGDGECTHRWLAYTHAHLELRYSLRGDISRDVSDTRYRYASPIESNQANAAVIAEDIPRFTSKERHPKAQPRIEIRIPPFDLTQYAIFTPTLILWRN